MKLQSDLLNIRLPHLLKFHLPKSGAGKFISKAPPPRQHLQPFKLRMRHISYEETLTAKGLDKYAINSNGDSTVKDSEPFREIQGAGRTPPLSSINPKKLV